jgi:PRTRC genetic system protein B
MEMNELVSIGQIEAPRFAVRGTLYFLEAQYLFRYQDGTGVHTKFLTPQDLAAAFSQKEKDSGWIPTGVVRAGECYKGPFYVYTEPAQMVTCTLEEGEEAVTFPIPRTVMLGAGNRYYIWAMKSNEFLADQAAFQAPFPNVYPDGKICWGKNSIGEADAKAGRKAWELFFQAPFSAHLASARVQGEVNDVRVLLKDLAEKKAKKFPAGVLLATNSTISYLVEEALREL